MRKWLRKSIWFQPPWIFEVAISAVVSGWIGYFVGVYAAEYAAARATPPPIVHNVWTNIEGKAQPISLLVSALRDEKKVTISFDPPSVESVTVCEYSRIAGHTYEDVLLSYLSKYSMCFAVSQPRPNEWTVRPNRNSSEMVEKEKDKWSCRCG